MNKKSKVTITLNDVSKEVHRPSIDVPSLIKKLVLSGLYMSLPAWMENYDIPIGTVASDIEESECYRQLVEWERSNPQPRHGQHRVSSINAKTPILVTPNSVTEVATNVVHRTMNGVVSSDVIEVMASVASTLISYNVLTVNGRNMPVKFPKDVPKVDLCDLKTKLKVTEKSATVSRDLMFERIIADPFVTMSVHTQAGANLSNYKPHAKMTADYAKANPTLPKMTVNTVRVAQPAAIPSTNNIRTAYQYFFDSSAARGESKGRGTLTVGYAMFECTRREVKLMNTIRDIRNILNLAKSVSLIIQDPEVDMQIVNSLIHSGYYVAIVNSTAPIMQPDDPPGVYSYLTKAHNAQAVTMADIKAKDNRPTLATAGITYQENRTKVILKTLRRKPRSFCYAHIDPYLYEEGYSYMPCSDADMMKVIVCYNLFAETFTIQELTKRATMAITTRNWYPFYRMPFCSVDTMDSFVRWGTQLYLPQGQQLKKKKDQYVLDLGSTGDVEITFKDEIPENFQVKFEEKDFKPFEFRSTSQYASALAYADSIADDRRRDFWYSIINTRIKLIDIKTINEQCDGFNNMTLHEIVTRATAATGIPRNQILTDLALAEDYTFLSSIPQMVSDPLPVSDNIVVATSNIPDFSGYDLNDDDPYE